MEDDQVGTQRDRDTTAKPTVEGGRVQLIGGPKEIARRRMAKDLYATMTLVRVASGKTSEMMSQAIGLPY